MSIVKLDHVYKSYGKVEALKDVSVDIKEKSFVVLAGPSGCGKTTLLQMIAGFLDCEKGNVYIHDTCVNKQAPDNRGIAMVFQEPALFEHLSVFDNIAVGLSFAGYSDAQIQEQVVKYATFVRIEDLLNRKARELSNGQKQRVSIARALVRKPILFLMDEPLSALDVRLKSQLRAEIAQLYQVMDSTFLYVTHDQMEAMTLADILIIMKDGEFQQIGKPMEIYNQPCNLFVANFLGKYEINQFVGKVKNRCICFREKSSALQTDVMDQNIIVGVRPEHMRIQDTGSLVGLIVLIENLGDELYFHVLWESQTVILKASIHESYKLHDTIVFDFTLEDAFYFDFKTHQRIQ